VDAPLDDVALDAPLDDVALDAPLDDVALDDALDDAAVVDVPELEHPVSATATTTAPMLAAVLRLMSRRCR
jgi:hypothetical protein